MNKLGLTDERFAQMMAEYQNDLDAVAEVVDDWGAERCNKGYDIFDFDGTGMLEIEAIDAVGCFDDESATEQAILDGIRIIPVEDLPEHFNRKYLGWIDTKENRQRIRDYCKKYLEEP